MIGCMLEGEKEGGKEVGEGEVQPVAETELEFNLTLLAHSPDGPLWGFL